MNISTTIAKHGVKIRLRGSTSRGIELHSLLVSWANQRHCTARGTGTWLILAELVNATSTALMIDSVFSNALLCGGFGSFKQFVANRVLEIHPLVKSSYQRNNYFSESNRSNICSRGSLISKLFNNHLSWNGRRFHPHNKELCPSLPVNTSDLELKKATS